MKLFLRAYLKKNLGDDLLLKVITARYKRATFYVNDSKKAINAFGARNICGRSTLRRVVDRVRVKLGYNINNDRGCSAMIVLGGSMFIDKGETKKEIRKNIQDRYPDNKPLFIIGCNFGPYKNQYYIDEYSKLFSRAKDVCFRDSPSASLFGKLDNVRVAPDIVFGLDISKYSIQKERKIIISVINLEKRKELSGCKREYEKKIAEIADDYLRKQYDVVLMSFCKDEGDEEAIKSICATMKGSPRIKCYNGNIDDILSEIASSEIVIGTRFHSIVLGLLFNKRVLPIIYSHKTDNMLNDINYAGNRVNICDIDKLDATKVEQYLYYYGSVERLSKKSEKHFEKLDEFLGRK